MELRHPVSERAVPGSEVDERGTVRLRALSASSSVDPAFSVSFDVVHAADLSGDG
jgi:hypothetical protein